MPDGKVRCPTCWTWFVPRTFSADGTPVCAACAPPVKAVPETAKVSHAPADES